MGDSVDYSVFREVWEKEYTVTRQLYRICRKWPDKTAIIDPFRNRTLTFRQWNEEANQFANALLDAGCTTYDSIVGDIFNTYEMVYPVYGLRQGEMQIPVSEFHASRGAGL